MRIGVHLPAQTAANEIAGRRASPSDHAVPCPALALDVTCLLFGPLALSPRGIDRVEMAYAGHFLENWPGRCVVVLPTAWGMRYFDREWALRGLRALEVIWRERIVPDDDVSYRRAKAFILTGTDSSGDDLSPPGKPIAAQARDFIRLLLAVRFSFGKPIGSIPKGSIYLNVGQLLFFRPWLSWLAKRKDISRIFMIHDLIPIEYPDHHVRLGVKLHENIIRNASEFADAVIVPSEFARRGLTQDFVPARLSSLPAHVEWLPVAPAFLEPADADPDLSGSDYYLACGAIDAHKNHILLLEVWKRLVERRGADAPKLVIAGFRSVTSQPIFDFIKDHPAIQAKVYIASRLSTPALRRLMMSARALLMPSLVEGFGLPVIEALAQGTPVFASDIPAFHESGAGGDVTYLPATEPGAWLSAIEMQRDSPAATAATQYVPKRWPDYFRGIESFLVSVVSQLNR